MPWNAEGADSWGESADWGDGTGLRIYDSANPGVEGTHASWNGGGLDTGLSRKSEDDNEKCRKSCGSDGHFAHNCCEGRKNSACFSCGEESHPKANCTEPRVFKGTCRVCNKEGHPAAECSNRPLSICKNCRMEGHRTVDCTENRKFDLNAIPDRPPDEAWAALKKASDEKNLEDFRSDLKAYSKAVPQATFVDIEKRMREDEFNIYLIAMEKEVGDTMSLINLQGKLSCQYVVGFFYSPRAQRQHLRDRWRLSVEDNLERLAEAGFPYDRQVPKCGNCNQMGHTSRSCKEERVLSYERPEVRCFNCNAVGHRVRDCLEPRRDKFICRNCGSTEHKASECNELRSAEGVECRKCGETGHFAKDCPKTTSPRVCHNCGSEDHIARDCEQPRNASTVTCRNCDEVGHFSRDCTKKRDYSRVQCRECGDMGHTSKRCAKINNGGASMESAADNYDLNDGGSHQDNGNESGWVGGDNPRSITLANASDNGWTAQSGDW